MAAKIAALQFSGSLHADAVNRPCLQSQCRELSLLGAHRAPLLSAFQSEANLQGHLPMVDLAVLDLTTGFGNLEPAHIANCFLGTGQGIFDRFFESLW